MSPKNRNRAPGFDTVAPVYPLLERLVYGGRLEKGRSCFLTELGQCRNLLLLGEGNGRFLRALLNTHPDCHATVVEISPKMTQAAHATLTPEQATRVSWLQQSVFTAPLQAGTFDAVVTHYLFDLFEPPEQERLLLLGQKALARGGLWQDTEFLCNGTSAASRLRNRLLLALSYRVLGALCNFPARRLTNPFPLFANAGFTLRAKQTFHDHLAARLWQKP